jgi:thiol-disulfide isomerase/thioredoxin
VIRGKTFAAVLVLLVAAVTAASGYEADLAYAEGILELTGSCFVRGIKLGADPIEGIGWPEPEGEALYGVVRLGEDRHGVMIDASGGQVRLYVDADRSGTATLFEWERMRADGSWLASVPFEIGFDDGTSAPYRLFVIWSLFTPTVLTYCRDSYREGTIDLEDRTIDLIVIDEDSDGRYDALDGGVLLIDADGDGVLLATDDSHERFELDAPFNLDGIVYRVASVTPDGGRIRLEESDEEVAPKLPLLVSFPAPNFEAEDADGEPVSIEGLRGSIVVLDFWAGWCSPCVAELPTLARIAAEFDDDGVVVLGINLDRSTVEFEEAVAEHAILYSQVYDGPDGPINTLYRVSGIPMTYVIDRDGIIRGRGLRAEGLRDAVEALLLEETEGDEGEPQDP